ncbi:MAG: hypothetical protein CL677_03105 [Bdellovibrionaceae bacterium]|nr:hypothetical protein [Pseudobdellovibrionaceae bacterium]|tara:strand:+ start:114114 stop:114698 length:585 start_codon:yes stop_codon:yes gene_type:complete
MRNIKMLLLAAAITFGFSSANAVTIDTAGSTFKWKATKKIGGGHYGTIKLLEAKATVKEGKIVSGNFVMDMTSFTVDDLDGGMEKKFLGHVKSGDFFQVGKYPKATLTITGQKDNKAIGKLKIKKDEHPIEVAFVKKDNTYVGTMEFDRTKYDITYGSDKFFSKLAADKVIDDIVKVDFILKTAEPKAAKKKTK